jgi:hypothetical protein
MPRWTSSSGYFFGRPIAAEALLSRGQKPRFEVSAKPGLAQCDPPIRSGRRSGSADVSFVSLAVSAPVVAAGWFALPWLLLYSDEFDVAVPPARILLIAAVARFPARGSRRLRPHWASPSPAGEQGSERTAIAFVVTSVASRVAAIVTAGVVLRRAEAAPGAATDAGRPILHRDWAAKVGPCFGW